MECVPVLWKIYLSLYEMYNRSSLLDSPPSIIFMQLKEMIEIGLQTITFYYYSGSQNNIVKWLISPYKDHYMKCNLTINFSINFQLIVRLHFI